MEVWSDVKILMKRLHKVVDLMWRLVEWLIPRRGGILFMGLWHWHSVEVEALPSFDEVANREDASSH